MFDQNNAYSYSYRYHHGNLNSRTERSMDIASSNGDGTRRGSFNHADLPMANYCSMNEFDVDDFNADDLFSNLDGHESCSGTPAPLMRADAFASGNINNISNGTNDDISYSVERDKPFPLVLHSIVSDEATNTAIHWLPCGKRFVVADKEEFSKIILPKYFGGRGSGPTATSKFTSFTRRLKRWNFKRVASGRELGAYHHEYFQRDQPKLAKKIVYPMGKQSSSAHTARGQPGSPKITRRASTGSAPALLVSMRDISPAPIKNLFSEDSADEMSQWLSSSELALEGASFPSLISNKRHSTNPSPDTHYSSDISDPAFLIAPPPFPSSTFSGSLPPQQGAFPGSKLSRPMRRHSSVDPHLSLHRMGNLHNTTGSCSDAYPNHGTNLSSTPEAAMIPEGSLSMSFSPNDVFSAGEFLDILPSMLRRTRSSSDGDDFADLFAKELSYDIMNLADPFT